MQLMVNPVMLHAYFVLNMYGYNVVVHISKKKSK